MFHDIMARLDFLPNSPTLMNAGRQGGQLAACFVLPVEDSMEGIFDSLKHMALIHKSGGGTGYNFSELRPKGDKVSSTNGVASGPVSFMGMFDHATEVVMQGGMRRGANMGILNADHPDVFDFIRAKTEEGKLTNFNISVGATDDFMRAVENDGYWDLKNPRTREVVRTVKARELMALICEMAWKTGDPGMVFLDKLNKDNPLSHLGPITSTNPCVTGDTLVHTVEGPKLARNALRQEGHPFAYEESFFYGRGFFQNRGKTVSASDQGGLQLRLTGDHPVLRVQGKIPGGEDTEWVVAGKLRSGDRIKLNDHRSWTDWEGLGTLEQGYAVGLLAGEGTAGEDEAVLSLWAPYAKAAGEENMGQGPMAVHAYGPLASSLGMLSGNKGLTRVMETHTSSDFVRGFLRGFFDADGSIRVEQEKGVSGPAEPRVHCRPPGCPEDALEAWESSAGSMKTRNGPARGV